MTTRVLLFATSIYFLGSTARTHLSRSGEEEPVEHIRLAAEETPVVEHIRLAAEETPVKVEHIRSAEEETPEVEHIRLAKESEKHVQWADRERNFIREDMKQKFLKDECKVSFTRTWGWWWLAEATVILHKDDKDTSSFPEAVILSLSIEKQGTGKLMLLYDKMQRDHAPTYRADGDDETPFHEDCKTKLPDENEWYTDLKCTKIYLQDNPVRTSYDVEVHFYHSLLLETWGYKRVIVHIDCTDSHYEHAAM